MDIKATAVPLHGERIASVRPFRRLWREASYVKFAEGCAVCALFYYLT